MMTYRSSSGRSSGDAVKAAASSHIWLTVP